MYGWPFDNGWLPPIAVKTPSETSVYVPRRGGSSTPFAGTADTAAARSRKITGRSA